MTGSLQLSSLLLKRRTEIIERWTQRIEREHHGRELSCGEICDHLPLIFDELLGALRAQEICDQIRTQAVRRDASELERAAE